MDEWAKKNLWFGHMDCGKLAACNIEPVHNIKLVENLCWQNMHFIKYFLLHTCKIGTENDTKYNKNKWKNYANLERYKKYVHPDPSNIDEYLINSNLIFLRVELVCNSCNVENQQTATARQKQIHYYYYLWLISIYFL